MAERESAHGSGNQTKDRKRKQIFSVYEIEVITDNIKKNLDLIQSKLTNAVTNKKKQMLWEEITQAVNAVGTAKKRNEWNCTRFWHVVGENVVRV